MRLLTQNRSASTSDTRVYALATRSALHGHSEHGNGVAKCGIGVCARPQRPSTNFRHRVPTTNPVQTLMPDVYSPSHVRERIRNVDGYGPVRRSRLCRGGRSLQTAEPKRKGQPCQITNKEASLVAYRGAPFSSKTWLDSCRLVSPIISTMVLLTKRNWSAGF